VRALLLFFALLLGLQAGPVVPQRPIEVDTTPEGYKVLRIHMNYLNLNRNTIRVRGVDGRYTIDFPLPDKWELVKAGGYIRYVPSTLLLNNLSAGVVLFNDKVVSQFKLDEYVKTGIKFSIDPKLFKSQNKLSFEAIMHYTLQCEDGTHSTLWTELDLQNSYLELVVRPKPLPESVSAIPNFMFDQKQYDTTPVHYLIDQDPDNQTLHRYAMVTAAIGNMLQFRLTHFDLSSKLDNTKHNVIIASPERAKEILRANYGKFYLTGATEPILSVYFNNGGCEAWINRDHIAIEPSEQGVSFTQKGAMTGESLQLRGGKVNFSNLPLNGSQAVTVSMWYKPDASSENTLFSFGAYALIQKGEKIGFTTGSGNLFGTKYRLKSDRWYHIVAQFDNTSLENSRLFIDGELQDLRALYGDVANRGVSLENSAALGGIAMDNAHNAHAMFDQLLVYNRPLDAVEVRQLYTYAEYHRRHHMSESLYLSEKLQHDINVIQNPLDVSKGIIVISPKNGNYEKALYALFKQDLTVYSRQGLDIGNVILPAPAEAYTAKNFLPTGKKIYFDELGYKTKLLKGWYPENIKLNFKLYPDDYIDPKKFIETKLHYVFPSVIREDSVANFFLNDQFAYQVDVLKGAKESQSASPANLLIDLTKKIRIPSYLLARGKNEMHIDFSLIPLKKGPCEVFNTENLVATVMDDSYFVFPKAKKWVEMPYLEYVRDAEYPYSIYPDLQDTVIYLADKQRDTLGAAMDFIFLLSESLQEYPYYLTITDRLDEKEKQKHIVVFGTISDPAIQALSKDMPIQFSGDSLRKTYPFIKKFIDEQNILDDDRLTKYRYKTVMDEENFVDGTLIVQLARSPFNADKVVQMFTASTAKCLKSGIESIYRYSNRHYIAGDLVLYNHAKEEGLSFNIKDKYILSKLNWIDTAALWLQMHPYVYIAAAIVGLLFIVWVLRLFLGLFRRKHHQNAKS